ncbi:VMAP-C domain-containing protein [Streptomyces sp. MUM 178J]|uniref:VMAP-C domain-containing protein n=1 Tax=Streptomyces sp. MUM 178J TaxID=2791991 RepID=UPI001F0357C2|nr:hypothetical protein [Streptomyces sp. MUM 178J]WRQ78022.1 hypothetical protein I3F59_000705 [Streptomyces sp. MUM 178J]
MEGRSPARVRNELMAGMADALQDSATVRSPGSRELWLNLLEEELASPIEPYAGDALRPWLLRLLEVCVTLRGGLHCLVRSLTYVEQASTCVTALRRLVDEWEAVDSFDGADLHPLRPVLRSVGPAGLTLLARRASRGRVQELPSWCDTAWQVFLRLAGENAAQGQLPASMAFLALTADRLVDEGQSASAEELRRWNRHQARAWGLDREMADWQYTDATSAPPSLVPAYLMIQFEPDGIDAERYYLSHWRQSDTEGWHPIPGETQHLHRDELPAAVEQLIERAEEKWTDLRQPVILEFILPWELLNEPVEWWHKESSSPYPTPLVMDYAVFVRSLERLRRASWHRPWHNKWRQLKDQPGDSHSHWSRPADGDGRSYFFHLERELKEDQQAVCLVLSRPPGGDDEAGHLEYLSGLRAGVPAMIWHRGDCADPAFRAAVGELVQDRGLGSLTERAARWRKEALALGPDAWDGHVGRHLAILIDDPERKPGPPGPGYAQAGT